MYPVWLQVQLLVLLSAAVLVTLSVVVGSRLDSIVRSPRSRPTTTPRPRNGSREEGLTSDLEWAKSLYSRQLVPTWPGSEWETPSPILPLSRPMTKPEMQQMQSALINTIHQTCPGLL